MLLDPKFLGSMPQTVIINALYPASPVYSAVPEAMLTPRAVSLTVARRMMASFQELVALTVPEQTALDGEASYFEPRDFDVAGIMVLRNVVRITSCFGVYGKEQDPQGKGAIEELHISFEQAILDVDFVTQPASVEQEL